MVKSKLASKTLWFAILLIVTGVANAFGFAEFDPGPELGGFILAVIGVVVGLLRFVTRQPIAEA